MRDKDNTVNMRNSFYSSSEDENLESSKIMTSTTSTFSTPPPSARSIAMRRNTISSVTQSSEIGLNSTQNSLPPTPIQHDLPVTETPLRISELNHSSNLDQSKEPTKSAVIPQNNLSFNTIIPLSKSVIIPVNPIPLLAPVKVDVESQSVEETSPSHPIIALFHQPVNPTGIHNRNWTVVINLLHVLNVMIAPLAMAWTDIFTQSRMSYKNEYGIEIQRLAELRDDYLFKRYGWLEVISSLPWDLWGYQYKTWAILRFVKMMLRVPFKRIYDARIGGVALPISRLIKTMLILMVLGHLDCCIFWFIELMLDSTTRWIDTNYLLMGINGDTVDFTSQYLTSYLASLRSLVLKPREVTLNTENVFGIIEFIAGILAYGTVFGNIHSIVEMMDHTAASTQAGR
ncbi:Cyclic nucleotide-gated olfactory channel, partial [Nowakowskiella sp. JEL0078]